MSVVNRKSPYISLGEFSSQNRIVPRRCGGLACSSVLAYRVRYASHSRRLTSIASAWLDHLGDHMGLPDDNAPCADGAIAVTQLLRAANAGDSGASARLLPLVY